MAEATGALSTARAVHRQVTAGFSVFPSDRSVQQSLSTLEQTARDLEWALEDAAIFLSQRWTEGLRHHRETSGEGAPSMLFTVEPPSDRSIRDLASEIQSMLLQMVGHSPSLDELEEELGRPREERPERGRLGRWLRDSLRRSSKKDKSSKDGQ